VESDPQDEVAVAEVEVAEVDLAEVVDKLLWVDDAEADCEMDEYVGPVEPPVPVPGGRLQLTGYVVMVVVLLLL
jgi:hypothetical protein